MNKIVLLENNRLGNIFFAAARTFPGNFGKNLCLSYVGNYKRGGKFLAVRIGYVDDNKLNSILVGDRMIELDRKRLSADANIYLLNESDLDINTVVERISKYFNKNDIVTFSDDDFAVFKEECKFLAKQMGSGDLKTRDDYVDYVSDLDLNDCYERCEFGQFGLKFYLLTPVQEMLRKKGINY